MSADPVLLEKVRNIVADVLGVDLEDATPERNFFHDLGGESIDVLDLQFRVEKDLGIRMQFQEMFSASRWPLDDQGRFTPETRERLGVEFPFLKPRLQSNDFQTPYDLLTVGQIADFVAVAGAAVTAGKH